MKLHLGCGQKRIAGFINVDREPSLQPDQIVNLEVFPWPWETNSVEEVVMEHVLEHLGQNPDTYLTLISELYRICKPQALIHIVVPHPRSDGYLADPTHVRPILPEGLELFSQEANRITQQRGWANTPLAQILNVDFRILEVEYQVNAPWLDHLSEGKITDAELQHAMLTLFNVVNDIRIEWQVVK